ncbi:MAG: LON peptidase substrate-binding domain-containing protein [Saprospiraceae bacterium]|nr:LON peptidase substrate-binding domain-containing protein [Saprospiraceae bacterium]MBP7699553.1 LON peptidase substrate-binding domain-containing protein [Saprospiraceae bacterium]
MTKDILPQFPLKLVVFPEEQLNLHIFEPRYKQLIGECAESGNTFGIPAFLNNRIMDVGTEVRMKEIVKKYPNGEMDIKTEGLGIYKIDDFHFDFGNRLYSAATISKIATNEEGNASMYDDIAEKVKRLFKLLKITYKFPDAPNSLKTYHLAHHVGLTTEQEYDLLCLPDERQRQEFILEHLERLLPVVTEMERLRERVQLNGHFKNISPLDFK